MNRKKLLVRSTALMAIIAVFLSAAPFIKSMVPTETARNKYLYQVPVSAIPADSYLEKDWQLSGQLFGGRVFIVNPENPAVYWVPYRDGQYWLPDLTWDKAIVPCQKFIFSNQSFHCTSTVSSWWQENAQWDRSGKPINAGFEPMRRVKHHVKLGVLYVGIDA